MALIQIWMCGGSLEIHPCSHVGHIFRTTSPHKWDVPKGGLHPVKRNAMRVAEVWLDEYRLFYYERSNYPIVGIKQPVARPSSRRVSHHSQSSSSRCGHVVRLRRYTNRPTFFSVAVLLA